MVDETPIIQYRVANRGVTFRRSISRTLLGVNALFALLWSSLTVWTLLHPDAHLVFHFANERIGFRTLADRHYFFWGVGDRIYSCSTSWCTGLTGCLILIAVFSFGFNRLRRTGTDKRTSSDGTD
jgi:hypothetical protein